jgi:branched-chain amino acid transport system substrate-binding protein
VFPVYGYTVIDSFIRASQKPGATLSTDSFIKAMDTMVYPPDIFGSSEGKFGPQKRLGNNQSRLSVLQDARWKVVSDYITQ